MIAAPHDAVPALPLVPQPAEPRAVRRARERASPAPQRVPTSEEHLATMRSTVRAGATNRPGVYRMLSGDGEIVYVGKSKQVRSRLLSYFRGSYPEDKGARIIREASAIDWEYTPSEFAALLHELRSIKRWRPRFNVRMKRDAQHYAFIKVSRAPAPKLQVVRGAGTDDGGVYYGPYVGAHRVNDAIRELNDVLGLRDCSRDVKIHFADQRELFQLTPRTPGCIRHEIRKCLGPCVGGCTAGEYDAQLAAAREFLDGTSDGPLESLRSQMADLAERMEFERAGVMRDKLRRLEALREQLERMRFAVETLSFVYTVSGHDGDDRCYLIRRGRVRDECPAPTTAAGRRALAARVREVFTPPERDSAAVATHEIDELLLLSSWFRRFPDELARTRPAGEFGVPAPV